MTKTVVILGAGWTGLPLAHKLLKYTATKIDLKVVLVSPSSHFFWNVAATRGIIPGAIPEEELFKPIQVAFSQYPTEHFAFLMGEATNIIPGANQVEIKTSSGSIEIVSYDQLVIATGSKVAGGLPLKLIGTHDATIAAWRKLQRQIQDAESIVVAGAGPTGVEVAGELAAKYDSAKSITLIMSGSKALDSAKSVLPSLQNIVEKDLAALGVTVIRAARVVKCTEKNNEGAGTLTLSNGSEVETDCFLPLYGVSLNSSFIPKEFLDDEGSVRQEPNMRVSGATNIWAIGDIGSLEPKQLTVTDNQIIYLSSALDAVFNGSEPAKPYEPNSREMLFIALGTKYATGQIGSWRLWRFLVAYVKGRKLFTDTADGYVGGKHLRHAAM